jgi:hypothetical protein
MSLGSAAAVTLGAGEVVAKVNSSAAVSVLASSRAFSASSAVFSVNRVGAEVALAVSEGQVDVLDTVSGQRRVVKAPASLRWSDGSALSESREEAAVALGAPVVPVKPWVRFGISPFGIGRPDLRPPGVEGFSQYDQLYADVELWLEQGWMDYCAPQLYWPSDRKAQPFGVLLDYWISRNPKGRHMGPGLFTRAIRCGAQVQHDGGGRGEGFVLTQPGGGGEGRIGGGEIDVRHGSRERGNQRKIWLEAQP